MIRYIYNLLERLFRKINGYWIIIVIRKRLGESIGGGTRNIKRMQRGKALQAIDVLCSFSSALADRLTLSHDESIHTRFTVESRQNWHLFQTDFLYNITWTCHQFWGYHLLKMGACSTNNKKKILQEKVSPVKFVLTEPAGFRTSVHSQKAAADRRTRT